MEANRKETMKEPIWLSKYQVIKVLGKGGSAEVFLARHIKLDDLRAIKRISKNNPLLNQLLLEANILKNLSHPCIPCIYDLEEDSEYIYIVEQYIKGQSLKEFCEVKKHLSEHLIISIGIQICDLLLYLYSLDNPILYLDLQPTNIIIDQETVKLIDFGTAIFRDQPDARGVSFGTPYYTPPESYTMLKPDEKADVYGIGALLYYMVYGRVPVNNKDKSGFVKRKENSYSKELKIIISQCMRFHRFFRIPTIAVLKYKLSKLNRVKLNKDQISNKSLKIAVGGSQRRIGTTHLAILITSYLDNLGLTGYYVEENDTSHGFSFLSGNKVIRKENAVIRVNNCNMIPKFYLQEGFKEIAGITVTDYGVITHENMMDFVNEDIKLLVTGGKEWEIEFRNRAFHLLNDCKDVIFLFNFLDGYQFGKQIKEIENKRVERIPYVPDPFYKPGNEVLDNFLLNITWE